MVISGQQVMPLNLKLFVILKKVSIRVLIQLLGTSVLYYHLFYLCLLRLSWCKPIDMCANIHQRPGESTRHKNHTEDVHQLLNSLKIAL